MATIGLKSTSQADLLPDHLFIKTSGCLPG